MSWVSWCLYSCLNCGEWLSRHTAETGHMETCSRSSGDETTWQRGAVNPHTQSQALTGVLTALRVCVCVCVCVRVTGLSGNEEQQWCTHWWFTLVLTHTHTHHEALTAVCEAAGEHLAGLSVQCVYCVLTDSTFLQHIKLLLPWHKWNVQREALKAHCFIQDRWTWARQWFMTLVVVCLANRFVNEISGELL